MSYEDNNQDLDNSEAVSFLDLQEHVLKPNDFCWGCHVGLVADSKEDKVRLLYETFRKGRTGLNLHYLFKHIYHQKKQLYPEDPREFTIDQIHQHFIYHIKDYFTELLSQQEKLATDIFVMHNLIYRSVPGDGLKQINGCYRNLLDAMKFQQMTMLKIEDYREKVKSANE